MLKVFNTLSRKKEAFKPRKGKNVNLFVCGPTTYDFSHLGHARTYIVFDMLVKYLKQKGYNVFYLQNITDIDDKIIDRAKKEKVSWEDLSRRFEREYLKDMKALDINSVKKYARASGHIKEIISQVKRLLKKGYAYQIRDGVYYNIKKFKDYGKLSKRNVLQAEDAVSRIDQAKEKKNKGDFCLWKFSKTGEPSWPSPWGPGRPGWHIEDTAITEKYFGPQYDIHGGARDLIFPHHEAEISQMEAISGKKPLVKFWLHTGFLTVKDQKMAKSLGNFITIKDFLKENPLSLLRFLVFKTHYRSPIDYNEKLILQTKEEINRIAEFVGKLKNIISSDKQSSNTTGDLASKTKREFAKAMGDDFNTPKAIAAIFKLVGKGNSLISQNKLSPKAAKDILIFLKKADEISGFLFGEAAEVKIPKGILELVDERKKYREKGLWRKADEIREKLKKLGYWIEDTNEGPKIKKLSN